MCYRWTTNLIPIHALAAWLTVVPPLQAGDATDTTLNPLLTDAVAVKAGRQLYRQLCMICHLKAGGRGPKLFRTKLDLEKFQNVVLNGKDNTQMPAFRERLIEDDVRRLHAFVMSRDRY